MKRIWIAILFILSVICSNACRQKNKQSEQVSPPQVRIAKADAVPAADTIDNALQSYCDSLIAESNKIDSLKSDFFRKYILVAALKNKELTEDNGKFLLALDKYLAVERFKQDSLLTPEKLLFPIFTLDTGKTGIVGTARYIPQSPNDISVEHRLISSTGYFNKVNYEHNRRTSFKSKLDSLYKQKSKAIYIYTNKARKQSEIADFEFVDGECLSYYYFPLKSGSFSISDRVLFGSTIPLDLIYETNAEFDKVIHKINFEPCNDCPDDSHPFVSFARLAGTNLYFGYSDTFPISNNYYPYRSLRMKINGRFISLWGESVDLLGCSCI